MAPKEKPAVYEGYSSDNEPMAAYATGMGIFSLALGGALLASKLTKKGLPSRVSVVDIALVGLATHTLTRIISKDLITTPLRAPFVTKQGDGAAPNEVEEKARGEGAQRALGQLVACPWCLAPWVASALSAGMVLAPKATRYVVGIFSSVAVSDWLNVAYEHAFNENPKPPQ